MQEQKLLSVATCIQKCILQKTGEQVEFELEYKPDWLKSVPDPERIKIYSTVVEEVYSHLVDHKYCLKDRLKLCVKPGQQSFDIWFGKPLYFAVEFDESQHFSQYRRLTLDYYEGIKTAFDVEDYKKLMEEKKAGLSGFQRLKSYDPLFPELLPGEKQDNRIRQRAFRDFLKDILPLEMGYRPTMRIPYHVTRKKIRDFDEEDLKRIEVYVKNLF